MATKKMLAAVAQYRKAPGAVQTYYVVVHSFENGEGYANRSVTVVKTDARSPKEASGIIRTRLAEAAIDLGELGFHFIINSVHTEASAKRLGWTGVAWSGRKRTNPIITLH